MTLPLPEYRPTPNYHQARKDFVAATRQQVAANVRYWRRLRGMSQIDLAIEAGVSDNFTQQLEAGNTSIVLSKLCQVAYALRVDLSALFQPRALEPAPRGIRGAALLKTNRESTDARLSQ
jgi:transcriptional regulator with XRE-family HTH domain